MFCLNNFFVPAQVLAQTSEKEFYAQSRADFINKLNIALKEAGETEYWITLLYKTEIIDEKSYDSLESDIKQIIGTLVKIINSSKKKKE